MCSVANAKPRHCDMLLYWLETEMPAKPRRSISRAMSRVASRRPGMATRLSAGNDAGIAYTAADDGWDMQKLALVGGYTSVAPAIAPGQIACARHLAKWPSARRRLMGRRTHSVCLLRGDLAMILAASKRKTWRASTTNE